MALIGVRVDKRTLTELTREDAVTYTHGLPGAPDTIDVRFLASKASTSRFIGICAIANATNITIQNAGGTTCPNMEVVAMCIHTIIQ